MKYNIHLGNAEIKEGIRLMSFVVFLKSSVNSAREILLYLLFL